ncbi:hypothetical protein D3C87_2172040 [compost metagenome]
MRLAILDAKCAGREFVGIVAHGDTDRDVIVDFIIEQCEPVAKTPFIKNQRFTGKKVSGVLAQFMDLFHHSHPP